MVETSVQSTAANLQPRHKPTVSEYQHRRRDVLGRIAGEPVAAVTVAASAVEPEDPHVEWWAEYQRLDHEGLSLADDDAFNELIDEQNDLLVEIATTPAATVAGVLAQVHVMRLSIEMGKAAWDEDALTNAIATLERLTNRPESEGRA